MKKVFIDTNVILRFLLKDHKRQSSVAKKLFVKALQGKIALLTLPIICAELIWVLDSYYQREKQEIIQKMRSLIVWDGLEIKNKDVLIMALQIYEYKSVDFIDAYVAAWMKNNKIDIIYSFDKDFDKIEAIKRLNFE